MATILDPQFKQKVFSSANSAAAAKQMSISECDSFCSNDGSFGLSSKCSRIDHDTDDHGKDELGESPILK